MMKILPKHTDKVYDENTSLTSWQGLWWDYESKQTDRVYDENTY